MKAIVSIILFLFIITLASAQGDDSTAVYEAYDTVVVDTASNAYYDDYDSKYESSTYTQKPGELNPAREERNRPYTKKKFSKTEWKKIVGETNYTEESVEEEKEEEKKSEPSYGGSSPWNPAILKIIGYVLIVVLLAAVIFYLLKNALRDTDSISTSIHSDSLLYGNQNIDQVTESDIDRLLREAIERGDLRAAVRLYYIKLLKHLHTTGFISWKKDKTNHEYASELSARPFTRDFRKLMLAYEIIWYGERTPSAEEFKKLQTDFTNLHHQATRTE